MAWGPDFRRLLPGIVLLLLGAALFVLWVLLAFASLFAFFMPELRGAFYLSLDVLVASVALLASGVILVIAGLAGWWRTGEDWGWIGAAVTVQAEGDRMGSVERFGEVAGAVVSTLVLAFFAENQLRGTGFFTQGFGPSEAALFYGTWGFAVSVPLARAAHGRKNSLRPLAALEGALVGATALWLLEVFPFDFSYLASLVPVSLKPAMFWSTNLVGKVVIVLVAFGGLGSMVYNFVVYLAVRSRQRYGGAPHSL